MDLGSTVLVMLSARCVCTGTTVLFQAPKGFPRDKAARVVYRSSKPLESLGLTQC